MEYLKLLFLLLLYYIRKVFIKLNINKKKKIDLIIIIIIIYLCI